MVMFTMQFTPTANVNESVVSQVLNDHGRLAIGELLLIPEPGGDANLKIDCMRFTKRLGVH